MLGTLDRPLLLMALVVAAAGQWCVIALLRPTLRGAGLAPDHDGNGAPNNSVKGFWSYLKRRLAAKGGLRRERRGADAGQ